MPKADKGDFAMPDVAQTAPPIEVEGPDGVIVEFPAGTPTDVMEKAMQARFGAPSQQQRDKQSMASGIVDSLTQGMAMGWGDELTGLESALLGKTPQGEWFNYDKPFWDRYDAARNAENAQQQQFHEDHPVVDTAAEITGALATGGAAARGGVTLLGRASSLPGAIGTGAAEGAAYGSLYGAGEAEPGRRMEGAAYGAGTGAITGGALAGIGGAIQKGLQARKAIKAAPTREAVKDASQALYDQADNLGVVIKAPAVDRILAATRSGAGKINAGLRPKTAAMVDELTASKGQNLSLRDLDEVRQVLGRAMKNAEPDDLRTLTQMKSLFDQSVDKLKSADISGDIAGFQHLKDARTLWSRSEKAKLIEDAISKAQLRSASTGSGGNVNNAIKQNLRKILDNKKMSRSFTQEELALMTDIVKGGKMQNLARLIGKASPEGNGLGLVANVVGATYNPTFLAGTAVSTAAKRYADKATINMAEKLAAQIRSGDLTLGQAVSAAPGPKRAALERLLSGMLGGEVSSMVTGADSVSQ